MFFFHSNWQLHASAGKHESESESFDSPCTSVISVHFSQTFYSTHNVSPHKINNLQLRITLHMMHDGYFLIYSVYIQLCITHAHTHI